MLCLGRLTTIAKSSFLCIYVCLVAAKFEDDRRHERFLTENLNADVGHLPSLKKYGFNAYNDM